MSAHHALASLLLLALLACDGSGSGPGWDPGLQRMVQQPSYQRYALNPILPGGATLQPPVPGSVPRERELVPPQIAIPLQADGTYLRRIPMPIGRHDLAAGRASFTRWCVPCHGVRGDGVSFVATRMRRVTPANLLQERLRQAPDGYLFTVITHGHGYMDSYAAELAPAERWRVVAFVRALQLSQHLELERLDDDRRSAIEGALP